MVGRVRGRRLAALLGFLLPIWTVGSVPPVVFDVARAALVVLLLATVPAHSTPEGRRVTRLWLTPLIVLTYLYLTFALIRGEDSGITVGVTMVVSVAAGMVVAARPRLHEPVLVGLLAGATLSAVVVILQARGIYTLTQQSAQIGAYLGLSSRSTMLTYELAAAIVVAAALLLAPGWKRRTLWLLTALAVCILGLLIGGGRGGVAAAGLAALVVALRLQVVRLHHVVLTGLGLWGAVWALPRLGVEGLTLDRLLGAVEPEIRATGFTNGRWESIGQGWEVMMAHPVVGIGGSTYIEEYRISPHFSPVSFGVAVGALGFLIAALVLLRLVRGFLQLPAKPRSREAVYGYGLAAMLVGWSLLEPGAPFVGIEPVLLLALAFAFTARAQGVELEKPAPPPRPRRRSRLRHLQRRRQALARNQLRVSTGR